MMVALGRVSAFVLGLEALIPTGGHREIVNTCSTGSGFNIKEEPLAEGTHIFYNKQ